MSMMKDNFQMEINLLGKILNSPKEYYDVHSLISEGLFIDPLNRRIYKVLSELLNKGEKVDPLIIRSKINDPLISVRLGDCISSDHFSYITKHLVLFLSQEDKKTKLKSLLQNTTIKIDKGHDPDN